MLAVTHDHDMSSIAGAQTRPGDRAALRAHAHGQAGRRNDPLRGRAGWRGGARPQAKTAGPRHLGHGTRDAVEQAVKRKVFARGFKRDVRVAPDLAALTERLLERAALDALAIAGKAGRVVAGFAKVEARCARTTSWR